MALAKKVMDIATGEAEEEYVTPPTPEQSRARPQGGAGQVGEAGQEDVI